MATVGSLVIGIIARTAPFEKAIKRVERSIDRTGKHMSMIGMKMTMGLTVPLAVVGGVAIKSAIDFETAFTGVEKTVDGTVEQMASLKSGIKSMATEIPASTTAISAVAAAAGQLGIKTENILGFTRVMIDLGETTNLSAEEAATALARLANITGLPQDQFDRLGSTIVELGNNLATTEAEIVQMGLRLAGAGKQVGLSQAEILGLAAALSSVGVEAQAGGSSFSRVMVEMSKSVESGNEKLTAFAKVAGISAEKFSRLFRTDAAGAIVAFVEGLGRMKTEGGNVFEALDSIGLGGIRVRDSLLRAANSGDLFARSIKLGSDAFIQNTALTDEAAKRYATVASKLGVLKNLAVNAAVILGDALIPSFIRLLEASEPLIQGIANTATAFAALDPSTQKMIFGFTGIVAAAGPLLFVVGKILSGISGLIPVIAALTSPIGLVVTAITLWIVRWEELRDGSITIMKALSEGVIESITGLKNSLFSIMNTISEGTIGTFQRLYDVVVGHSIIPDMVDKIGAHMKRLKTEMVIPTSEASKRVQRAFSNLEISGARTMGGLTAGLLKGALSFEDFASRAIRALIRLAAQQAAMAMGGPAGAFAGALFGGMFAAGGRPQPGEVVMTGEKGPEPFVPDTHGRFIPTNKAFPTLAGAGGGGIQVSMPVSIADLSIGGGSQSGSVARDLERGLEQLFMRPNGLTDRVARLIMKAANKTDGRAT